jgi:hypothetical protein
VGRAGAGAGAGASGRWVEGGPTPNPIAYYFIKMAEWGEGIYDDVALEDMEWVEEEETYFYPCPCGDKFFITLVSASSCNMFTLLVCVTSCSQDELYEGEEIATCPSCSLVIRVIYEEVRRFIHARHDDLISTKHLQSDLPTFSDEEGGEEEEEEEEEEAYIELGEEDENLQIATASVALTENAGETENTTGGEAEGMIELSEASSFYLRIIANLEAQVAKLKAKECALRVQLSPAR